MYQSEQLQCFGELTSTIGFDSPTRFTHWCQQQQSMEWVVYAKAPFAGPQAVLNYRVTRIAWRLPIADCNR